MTSRDKAENGRSNGGVINVVTKSGTNTLRGSFFTLFRDDAMNAKTTTEKNNNSAKQAIAVISTAAASVARSRPTGCTTSGRSSGRSRTPSRS